MERILTECFDYEDKEDLLAIVNISLMYYGLLRQNEVMSINVEDITLVKDKRIVHVNYPRGSKHRVQGFSFTIPTKLYGVFGK